jgi:hypothetical protein
MSRADKITRRQAERVAWLRAGNPPTSAQLRELEDDCARVAHDLAERYNAKPPLMR